LGSEQKGVGFRVREIKNPAKRAGGAMKKNYIYGIIVMSEKNQRKKREKR
jgi:hypothetical protein